MKKLPRTRKLEGKKLLKQKLWIIPLFEGGVGRKGPEADEEKQPERRRRARNSHG